MEYQSKFDPERETVGAIYRQAVMHPNPDKIEVGDMSREMMKGLAEDVNAGIAHKPFGSQPWYIMIHEKKDLHMKQAFLRRVLHFKYRPYPENDTTVFWHDPESQETRFCWCLPHRHEMRNMLMNPNLFDKGLIEQIKAWMAVDLNFFGFNKNGEGHWIANPFWKDKPLKKN